MVEYVHALCAIAIAPSCSWSEQAEWCREMESEYRTIPYWNFFHRATWLRGRQVEGEVPSTHTFGLRPTSPVCTHPTHPTARFFLTRGRILFWG